MTQHLVPPPRTQSADPRRTSSADGPRHSSTTGIVLTRAIAVLALACVGLHVGLVVAAPSQETGMALAMLLLSAVCASCARAVWRHGAQARTALWTMFAGAAAMNLVHLFLQHMGSSPAMHAGHAAHAHTAHAAHAIAPLSTADVLMHAGVFAAGVQAFAIVLVLSGVGSRRA